MSARADHDPLLAAAGDPGRPAGDPGDSESAARAPQEQQLERSQRALAEAMTLQQLALRRQRTVTLVAVPGMVLCVGLIGWLLIRYF